jgi:Protein of unknown function (DUF3551)
MRPILMLAIAAATAVCATAVPGRAQTQSWSPWCAVYYGGDIEHKSCGYASYAQCMNAVRGGNETCFENIWHPRPAQASRSEANRPHKR